MFEQRTLRALLRRLRQRIRCQGRCVYRFAVPALASACRRHDSEHGARRVRPPYRRSAPRPRRAAAS